jgi:hypothetical protein
MRQDNTAIAAQAFIAANFDADKMRPLMNEMQRKSEYTQKRFWAIVDAAREERENKSLRSISHPDYDTEPMERWA